jgi:predicted aspartyl protease
MKKQEYFYSDKQDVIHLPGVVHGPLGDQKSWFVFDPGAYRTIITTELTDYLGYRATAQSKRITTGSVVGNETGYTIILKRLEILGFDFNNIEVACFDLPEQYEIDGLLGLDLLEKFEVNLRHRERWIQLGLLE